VESLASLLPLVGIALLFWLLMIRPAQRRQRETLRMQSAIEAGDEVMLTSGIFGTVKAVVDDRFQVEVAPGVVVEIARGAVGTVVTKAELSDEPERSDTVGTTDTTDTTDTEQDTTPETTEER
jgi:preprotein translocase subunit YajC